MASCSMVSRFFFHKQVYVHWKALIYKQIYTQLDNNVIWFITMIDIFTGIDHDSISKRQTNA